MSTIETQIRNAIGYPAIDRPGQAPGRHSRIALMLLPLILFAAFAILLALPITRDAVRWTLSENRPVEMLTFFTLFFGGVFGLQFSWRLLKTREPMFYVLFYSLFSFGLLLTGLEEIAWGQQLWGFATPESLKGINMQGETTIHNINGIHGNTEVFRLLFGLGGLIGIYVSRFRAFAKIAAPVVLFTWFAVITGHSAIDVFDDNVSVPKYMEAATSTLAELVELLIATAGFIYLYVNSKMFSNGPDAVTETADQ
ncbi:MAG: hypothetical protein OEM82_09185 [Acidobacteriota bacterium]|nr:hypothetical protein [Acidobacteriota bacterium]